jgi:cell wall-active antibiotic response 4TMS protein YvqF/B-box zinc finger protein
MNCANHADASAVAYCRTCGKALCANCTRPVKGVIYCEDCLGARMESTVPPGAAAFPPGTRPAATPNYVAAPAATSGSGPNPALAGILAGFFPFGVGAVYTGQYAKGLAHLIIFVLLVAGASAADSGGSEALGVVCGLGIAFFYVYQIIDSVRTARALQMGQPAPDPFGLARSFSTGTKIDSSRIPTGAIVLILLGVFFLLRTAGLFAFSFHHFWPLLLILLGGWIFATRWGLLGTYTGCTCERCRAQCLMGPAILVTLGVVGLIDSFRHVGFFGYLGGILLVIGGVKLFQGGASSEGHTYPTGPGPTGGVSPPPPVPPIPPAPPTSEVSRG